MEHQQHLCPYLERRDSRCAGVLTLTNLHEALGRCACDFECCSIYHRIRVSDLVQQRMDVLVARSA